MDTVDTVKKHVEDNEVWKPLVEKSLGVNFRNKVGLLEHQKLMIAADVADDDEISCPFMESFGKTSSSDIKFETETIITDDEATEKRFENKPPTKDVVKRHKCEHCSYSSNHLGHVNRHLRTHVKERPFKCSICSDRFVLEEQLKNHITKHTDEQLDCDECDKTFTCESDFKTHKRNVHGKPKPYTCELCHSFFATAHNLKVHMQTHAGIRKHKCQYCEMTFVQRSNLRVHERIHTGERPYKCTECAATFNRFAILQNHIISQHTKEFPFRCSVCDRGFVKRDRLKSHNCFGPRRKSPNRSLACGQCGKLFETARNARRHERCVHEKIRSHVCEICGSRFSQAAHHKQHMLTHTGERKFECKHCHRKFLTLSYLHVHERMHTGEKPYKCSECPATFADSSNLRYHVIRRHTKDFPFKCSVCGKGYLSSVQLKKHTSRQNCKK